MYFVVHLPCIVLFQWLLEDPTRLVSALIRSVEGAVTFVTVLLHVVRHRLADTVVAAVDTVEVVLVSWMKQTDFV